MILTHECMLEGVGLRMADGLGTPVQQFREMTDSSGTGMVGLRQGWTRRFGGGAYREEDCLRWPSLEQLSGWWPYVLMEEGQQQVFICKQGPS